MSKTRPGCTSKLVLNRTSRVRLGFPSFMRFEKEGRQRGGRAHRETRVPRVDAFGLAILSVACPIQVSELSKTVCNRPQIVQKPLDRRGTL